MAIDGEEHESPCLPALKWLSRHGHIGPSRAVVELDPRLLPQPPSPRSRLTPPASHPRLPSAATTLADHALAFFRDYLPHPPPPPHPPSPSPSSPRSRSSSSPDSLSPNTDAVASPACRSSTTAAPTLSPSQSRSSQEIWAPEVNDFILISDSAYTREQILKMEKAILIAGLPRPGR
ncbi:hypothetical protein VPH35_094550 [Triticum aestivum]